ncbi:MAG TPA: UDP-glucose 4-epimerase GalE [Gammaproteobacteria bacterium]
MDKKTVLVTGGAGYIGSHVVRQLGEAGENIVVLDDLSTGFANAVLYGELIKGHTGDRPLVRRILKDFNVTAVLHFAANTIVPESISNPLKYYSNNTCASQNLLACCQEAGVQHFIFSSTAAVYGMPGNGRASEDSELLPINPYGTSKLMTEWMLRDLAAASGLGYVILRYFNVAGSDPGGRIGQSTPKATLLIKVAAETAIGKRPHIAIYGTDYPTNDGTCVRDYIHVEDLADAHIKALHYLRAGGKATTLNCGYGHGHSVREVLQTVERIHGKPLAIREEARRPGDPPMLIADAKRIKTVLGWEPQFDDLEFIVQTSLDWERKLAS